MQILKGIFSGLLILMVTGSCSPSPKKTEIHGEAQGTTYSVIIADDDVDIKKAAIDSILADFDLSLSLYRSDSYLSRVNDNQSYEFEDRFGYFTECYFIAELLHEQSKGMVDPTLYPILNAWKLYSKQGLTKPIDSLELNGLMSFVGFKNNENYMVKFENRKVIFNKKAVDVKFDFNAMAQGFSADVISRYLETKGAQNYYVEIGGELVTKGKSPSGKKWRIAIDQPEDTDEDDRETQLVVSTSNGGVATSGSYRNYVEFNGEKYAHIFNPFTGKPQDSDVLSVTVFAPTAGLADGYATYFMLIGRDEIKQFCKENQDVSAIIIYSEKGKFKNEVIGRPSFVIND